jgi:hypothetical protein
MTFAEYVVLRDASLDENFVRSAVDQFKQSYGAAKGSAEEQYEKYAPKAQEAIANVKSQAQEYAAKLGIPLPLATALLAAGLVNPASVPFAALMYFVKKPLMAVANKGFDMAWDAGAKTINAMKGQPQQQPNMQPVRAEGFREFIAIMEAEGWGDWAGRKVGGAAGYVAGKAAGFGSKLLGAGKNVVNALKGRAVEIMQYAKNNPKEIARMAFLVGAGALIGAGVGKLTHDLKDMVVTKIKDVMDGVPAEEVAWLRKNIVLEPSEGGGFGTDKGSEEMLQQGSKDYMTVPDEPPPGEGRYIVGGTSIKDVDGDTKGMVDAMTDKHSGGKMGFINVQQQGSKSLEDAYRDAAKQMGGLSSQTSTGPWNPMLGKTTGLMPSLRDLNVNPDEMIARYGHSAADEISKRLASPDTLTIPGAIGGAAGTAAAQAGRKPRRA